MYVFHLTHLGFIVIAQKWQLCVEKDWEAHHDYLTADTSKILVQDV